MGWFGMGWFTQFGDTAEAGPDAAVQASGLAQESPDFEAIAGVSLEQFAAVSRSMAETGQDRSRLIQAGISAHRWESALQGWRDRIRRNHAVARRFNLLYQEV